MNHLYLQTSCQMGNSLFSSSRNVHLGENITANSTPIMAHSSMKVEDDFIPSFITNPTDFDDSMDETCNGLSLKGVYIPEEIMLHILSYIEPKDMLFYTLVCRKWNKLIKSFALWSTIYKRKYRENARKLPWYLYYSLLSTKFFNSNLLVNGNGQDKYNKWQLMENGGDRCKIEDPPAGADTLPLDVPEFNNFTSCFATSYHTFRAMQEIKLGNSGLFRYILNSYKPHIYLSEWTAGRFDCGCIYKLRCNFQGCASNVLIEKPCAVHHVEQWQGAKWEKIELTVTEYPEDITSIIFEHEGRDTQFWAGNYGSKMAGGVVKLLFTTIENLPVDEDGKEKPKTFSKIQFNLSMNAKNDSAPQVYHLWYDSDEEIEEVIDVDSPETP